MIMASSTGHVMNLSNSIIGVSLLAMPFCFKQCGITLAIIMLILSSIISRLACHFLVKSSTMCRRRNFEFLAFYTFGPSGKLLVELGVIGFMMGTCVAFFVVMGDLGPAIISKIFNINNNGTLRTSVLIGLGFLVVLPLGLLRNVESLAAISTVTIGYYFLFILKIFFESSPHLATGDWWSHVRFWHPEGILQCVPIFAMALSCQTQLFEIYNSLPSPSIEKMNSVVHSALNLCTAVYASVGLLGYIAYCKGNFTGNIMLSFTPSLSSEMFKLGFVLSIAVSFPLVIFPCRASLFSLMFKRMPIYQELSQTSSHIPDSRFKCLTVAIVLVALITGLLIPSIELVLGFVGSTIGIAICVIFPSLSFLNLYSKNTNERIVAKMILFLGVLIMITGTFGNLFAAVEQKSVPSPPEELVQSKHIQQMKVPPKIQSSTELAKKQNSKDVSVVNPIIPEKPVLHKSPEALNPRIKLTENVRKEPPVPIAPASNNKEKPNKPEIQIELIEKKKGESEKKPEPEEKKPKAVAPESKQVENINQDAIEKEEREIMEVEKQKETEEDRKQQELLQKLKKHQDEQKKLLEEQEKILKEMKDRKNENKQEGEPKKFNLLPEAKTIKPEEFKENLNKIQNVLDGLKETKKILEKEKLTGRGNKNESSSIEKPRAVEKLETGGENSSKKKPEVKNPVVSVPLPLVKRFQPEAAAPAAEKPEEEKEEKKKQQKKNAKEKSPKESQKSKQEILGRDILVERVSGREKREVETGECTNEESERQTNSGENEKTEKQTAGKTNVTEEVAAAAAGGSSALIKNSERLSLNMEDEKKSEMTAIEGSNLILDFQNQPFMSKKRDLKSLPTTHT